MTQVWIDGELVDADAATVPVTDHGITTGDGVFETLEVIGGRVFAPGRHLARLHRSAAALGLAVPHHDDVLRTAMDAVAAPLAGRAVVRVTVTGGPGPLGSGRHDVPATVIMAGAGDMAPWPASERVVVVPWRRNEHGALAGVKSTSYAENVMALAEAHRQGAGEAIFANTAGELCEGTGTNVFWATDGRLHTPPLASGCLAGITRELVMELVEVTETSTPVEALARADEAFLTSTTRHVHPIAAVDGVGLGSTPGPLTAAAVAAFADVRAGDIDP